MITVNKTLKHLLALVLLFSSATSLSQNLGSTSSEDLTDDEVMALTSDSRIKNYAYNPNIVYLLMLHFGFQSTITFEKGEKVQTIVMGDGYAWKITPLQNLLFVKALEKNIRTNMVVMTNKRQYQFDLVSQEFMPGQEDDLVYMIRFHYPKKRTKSR